MKKVPIKLAQSIQDGMKPTAYRECLFCEDSSQRKKVKGHSIQRSLIAKFLAENSHVIMFKNEDSMKFLSTKEITPFLSARAELVGVNQATTGYFTCEEHERIFEPIEQGPLELNRSRNRFLFALRAIAYQTWRVKVAHNAWHSAVKDSGSALDDYVEMFSDMMQGVDSFLQSALRRYDEKRYNCIKHKVIKVKTSPTLAVSEWSSYGDKDYLNYGLTVLPINERNTTAIIHYLEEDTEKLQASLGHLFAAAKQDQKQILSRVIIEDFENVTLSPRVWNQFGPEKQQRIREHYIDTIRDPNLHRLVKIEGEEHLNFFLD